MTLRQWGFRRLGIGLYATTGVSLSFLGLDGTDVP